MSMRKHYLDNHRTGTPVLLAAHAAADAARYEGERVELIGGHAVTVLGDPPRSAIERFAGDVERRMADREARAA